MGIQEDEQVCSSVALVFIVVAQRLPRLGWDWLSYFANELGRAFIEAHNRLQWIWRLGVQIKYIFHAGYVFGIYFGYAPHVLAPRLEVILGPPLRHLH